MYKFELLYKAGLSIGVLSLVIFFIGHLGLLSAPFLIVPAFICALFIVYFILKARAAAGEPFSTVERWMALAAFLSVLLIVPLALMPPSVRDELITHLAVPMLFLEKGRIWEIDYIGFTYLPQNIDLLYLIPLALGNDIAPRLIHLAFAVLTGLLIYFYLAPKAGRVYGLLGFIIYISTPLVFNLSRMAYIDNGAAFYSTLALFAALKWREEGFDKRWLIYSAIATGFALGAKYNTLLSFFLITVFVLISRRGRLPEGVKAALLYAVLSLAVLSPWLIRNYIWTGSPFYPLFESAAGSIARGEGVHITGEMAPMGKRIVLYSESALEILLLPLRLFWEGADNSIERFDGVLNPVFLVFLPFAFMRKGIRDLKWLALFSVLFFALAAFTVDLVTRYLLPIIPALAVIVTLGIRNSVQSRALIRAPAFALVAALFLFNIDYALGLYGRHNPVAYLFGDESREEYLTRALPDYDAVRFANRTLPQDAKVMLMFTGDRGYYWEREFVYGDRVGLFLKDYLHRSPDALALKSKFAGRGITHLFVNDSILERFSNDNFKEAELMVLAGFFNTHTKRLYSSKGYSIYELK